MFGLVMDICICPLKNATKEMERQLLNKAPTRFHNTYCMPEALGVNQSTIVRKLHSYELMKYKAQSVDSICDGQIDHAT